MKSSKVQLKKFLLLGKRKNYDLPEFKPGLNIIHGSSDTGKSMILRLISYCLGKNLVSPATEVMESCTHILVELDTENGPLTIKRDLHKRTAPIHIFNERIEDCSGQPDYICHIDGTQNIQSISSFLLEKFDIPVLKVPIAPTDPSKGFTTVSIKDIVNLLYLSDDDIANQKTFLGKTPYAKHLKYIESLKAALGIDNPALHELRLVFNEVESNRKEVKKTLDSIRTFLAQSDMTWSISDVTQLSKSQSRLDELQVELNKINRNIGERQNIKKETVDETLSLRQQLEDLSERSQITENKIVEFSDLLRSYNEKKEQFEALLEFPQLLQTEPHDCPVCKTVIESEGEVDTEPIRAEVKELNYKIADLKDIVEKNGDNLSSLRDQTSITKARLQELTEEQENLRNSFISPLLEDRDKILLEIGKLGEEVRTLKERSKLAQALEEHKSKLGALEKQSQELKQKIGREERSSATQEEIHRNLSQFFGEFIRRIRLASADNPRLDDKFIPTISSNDISINYYNVSGTGKRAALASAFFTAILQYSISIGSYMPKLLMIDSPGRGRGNNPADESERLDIETIRRMFLYWQEQTTKDSESQIIIVDSKLPPEEVRDRVLIKFDRLGTDGARKGLIDDWPDQPR